MIRAAAHSMQHLGHWSLALVVAIVLGVVIAVKGWRHVVRTPDTYLLTGVAVASVPWLHTTPIAWVVRVLALGLMLYGLYLFFRQHTSRAAAFWVVMELSMILIVVAQLVELSTAGQSAALAHGVRLMLAIAAAAVAAYCDIRRRRVGDGAA
jgi:hypothetical protein